MPTISDFDSADEPTPSVSVVCAWYNRADFIRDTVDSLLQQDFNSFEVIIVNDGSTDPRVRERLDNYHDPRLRIIHQENTGFVRAIRSAINASRAPFVAIQGAGDVSYPQRLKKQYEFLVANADFAITGCCYEDVLKRHGSPEIRRPSKFRSAEPTPADIRRGNPFGHGEVMMRRSTYDRVGGYRPFFLNSQDKDLWLRLASINRLHIIKDVLYERRVFATDGISASLRKTLAQIAFSRIADRCHDERMRGDADSVDRYGSLALARIPGGPQTSLRIIRAVHQVIKFGSVRIDELIDVRNLYGWPNYILAGAAFLGFSGIKRLCSSMRKTSR